MKEAGLRTMVDYATAGVDRSAHTALVGRVAALAAGASRPEVLAGVGFFAAACALPAGYREPVLVSGTDNVGTKVLLASALGRHQAVGVDCVAMCVNDILTMGAEPLFFLDYISMHRLDQAVVDQVVAGVAAGCREAGCALVGGETAQSGDIIQPGGYDLSGTAVGVVERTQLRQRGAAVGDIVVALPSSGLHSNGFTLVRRILADAAVDPSAHVEELLRPTRIYVRDVLAALRAGAVVHAMAHVTGGGLPGNLDRALPPGADAVIDPTAWVRPPIFSWLQRLGGVDEAEVRRVFNLGVGFCLFVPPAEADPLCRTLGALPIGEVVPGTGRVRFRDEGSGHPQGGARP
jgi:phosphoribosylformylglycinamidine cyclo-ligase